MAETPVDKLVTEIGTMPFEGIVAMGQNVRGLLNVATSLFARFDVGDQTVAMAVMFGVILQAFDGAPVQFERDNGVLMTTEDRIRIFIAQVMVCHKFASEAAQHPDCPKPKGVM